MTMSPQRRPSRGLSDLRTLAGRSDVQISSHKAYLRISFLELERARRMQEVRTYHDRFEVIRGRFREIDAEIANIRASLDSTAPRAQAVQAPPKSPVGRRPATRHFQFNY
jgi:hypothetical protein